MAGLDPSIRDKDHHTRRDVGGGSYHCMIWTKITHGRCSSSLCLALFWAETRTLTFHGPVGARLAVSGESELHVMREANFNVWTSGEEVALGIR